jgi:hypothetical protein
MIMRCPLRYILDESASRHCMELLLSGIDLLSLDPKLTRMPAQLFWIESVANPPISNVPGLRIGTLIEADPGGRSGTIKVFYGEADGAPALLPATIQFDLDTEPPCSSGALRIAHGHLRGVGNLLRHMAFLPDPAWMTFSRANKQTHAADMGELAEAAWIYLPFVVAYSVLLNTKGATRQRPSSLERLNAARAKRGRPALLDHVEVTMNLSPRQEGASRRSGGISRAPARFHLVRGHLVHRSGRVFWRKAHMRGDVTRAIATRTVQMTHRAARVDPIGKRLFG